ncbi:MAG: hypothetical protein QOI04_2290 [Verrucomicrobiota bacterium]|jgi:hypothetical protein
MKATTLALRTTGLLVALFLTNLVATSARAATVEGFESTTLTQGNNAIGDASIQGVYFGINPTQLTKQLLLTTIDNVAGADPTPGNPSNQSGFNAVANTNLSGGLASFFGVSSSSIRNGTAVGQEGSGFFTPLGSLSIGSTVSFNYDFLTKEVPGGRPDFAFVILYDSVGNVVSYNVFSQASSATSATTGVGNPFNLETGYLTFTLPAITTAGSYFLGLGVADATDKATASGVLIDNISVTPAAVPEPSTIGLGFAGAVLLVALRSRIKKQS